MTRLSFLERYDPYVIMAAIPSESEKNTCPPAVASILIHPEPWNTSILGLNMNSRPALDPSSVMDLIITIMSITNSAGIAIVVNFSIPPDTPPMMMIRFSTANTAVKINTVPPLPINVLKYSVASALKIPL